jgi:transcriptional regulator GlxA family with amidase domain
MRQVWEVAILIFDDVEVLDFCGPFEVFAVTGARDTEKPFQVYTVAEKAGPVIARNGLSVNPTYTLENCPRSDILIVPGGQGTRREMHNPVLIDWIRQQDQQTELTLSVCTGSLLLAQAGILHDLQATTHWGAMDLLRDIAPHTQVIDNVRYVDNGRVVTSAGISAGIDMSLHIVERLLGPETAAQTARQMQYDYWQPTA